MKDIYDIKELLLGLPININYSLIYIALFVIIILLLRHFLNYINSNKDIKIDEIIEEKQIDFYELLEELKKKYFESTKDVFYSKSSEIIRLFLEKKVGKNIKSMTFEEINNLNLDKNSKKLLKNIYFKEYAKKIEDNNEIRKDLILEVERLLR